MERSHEPNPNPNPRYDPNRQILLLALLGNGDVGHYVAVALRRAARARVAAAVDPARGAGGTRAVAAPLRSSKTRGIQRLKNRPGRSENGEAKIQYATTERGTPTHRSPIDGRGCARSGLDDPPGEDSPGKDGREGFEDGR